MNMTLSAATELGRKAGYSHLGRSEMGKDHTIYVSDTAWENLGEIAKSRGMSRSALIDSIGRGETVLGDTIAVSGNLVEELAAPTVSGNLMDDESIAAILQPPDSTN